MESVDLQEVHETVNGGANYVDHGWQKVSYPKRQRKTKSKADPEKPNATRLNGTLTNGVSNVFFNLEQQSQDRRRRIVEAQRAYDAADSDANKVKNNRSDLDELKELSRLLSQLESLRESEISAPVKEEACPNIDKAEPKKMENGVVEEEIVKELKALKRQNTITHCLISALIVVTVIWELSEVSLLLKLRDGFNHPFRSLGNMLVGMMLPSTGGGGVINVLDGGGDNEQHDDLNNHVVDPLLPSVVNPELPSVEFAYWIQQ